MPTETAKLLRRGINGKIYENAPLSAFTTMKVGGPADLVIFPKDVEELKTVTSICLENNIERYLLGKGSNVIPGDGGYRGAVIILTEGFCRVSVLEVSAEEHMIVAQSGASLSKILAVAKTSSLTGFEFAAGIPGSFGGALCMNAGTKTGEMKDVVNRITIMTSRGEIRDIAGKNLKFGYRNLAIPKGSIILEGSMLLRKGDKSKISNTIRESVAERRKNQPWETANSGCIFKNPKGMYAGKIIDELGLKGTRIGGAEISSIHGNFIVNRGSATASDVISLIETIKEKVKSAIGIELETEVKIIGEDE